MLCCVIFVVLCRCVLLCGCVVWACVFFGVFWRVVCCALGFATSFGFCYWLRLGLGVRFVWCCVLGLLGVVLGVVLGGLCWFVFGGGFVLVRLGFLFLFDLVLVAVGYSLGCGVVFVCCFLVCVFVWGFVVFLFCGFVSWFVLRLFCLSGGC